jgi:hypothetical protein
MGQAQLPPPMLPVVFGENENGSLALPQAHHSATAALCSGFGRGRTRCRRLLGREFFRSRVTSYTLKNFEDVVIFVTDMERAIDKLDTLEKRLLAMNVLEEYTCPRYGATAGCNPKNGPSGSSMMRSTNSRRILLAGGLLEELPSISKGQEI